jgi:hypothetical protein
LYRVEIAPAISTRYVVLGKRSFRKGAASLKCLLQVLNVLAYSSLHMTRPSKSAFVFLMIVAACTGGMGQRLAERFELGPDQSSVLLVRDPACPLQLREPANVYGYATGAVTAEYTVQNASSSNVESFTVEQINWWGNTIHTESPTVNKGLWTFGPGLTLSSLAEEGPFQRVQLDPASARKLRLLQNRVLIMMVTKVKLSDGTSYDASAEFRKLGNCLDEFFYEYADELTPAVLNKWEVRTLEYVASMFSAPRSK